MGHAFMTDTVGPFGARSREKGRRGKGRGKHKTREKGGKDKSGGKPGGGNHILPRAPVRSVSAAGKLSIRRCATPIKSAEICENVVRGRKGDSNVAIIWDKAGAFICDLACFMMSRLTLGFVVR